MALVSHFCAGKHKLNGLFNRLYKVSKYNNVQVAHITRVTNRVQRPRPPPFNYIEKNINYINYFFDYITERYDENTRMIVIDGPIAAGKDKFARELAKNLGMGYMPAVTFDRICQDGYGFDIRSVDHVLPERMQICDVERFLTNPKHANAAAFQLTYFFLKLEAYMNVMLHILMTGEGVVMNRSVHSDFVFMKAMYNAGYINKKCRNFYNKTIYPFMSDYVLNPHLVIYLDVPVNVVEERIKERCIPYEVNSKVLTKKYLTDIENIYKEKYLPEIEDSSYLLMYDWTKSGDINDVIDDIERINMDYDPSIPNKLFDWVIPTKLHVMQLLDLYKYEERIDWMSEVVVNDYTVTEMYLIGEDVEKQRELYEKYAPKYDIGYNRSKGDKKLLFKASDDLHLLMPKVISNKELLKC